MTSCRVQSVWLALLTREISHCVRNDNRIISSPVISSRVISSNARNLSHVISSNARNLSHVISSNARNLTRALVIATILVIILASSAMADGRRVVVVVAGGISIRDIADPALPGFPYLYQHGAVGLMNVRTGRASELAEYGPRAGMESGCIALGAGAPAVGGTEARKSAEPNELVEAIRCADRYKFLTGLKPSASAILHTEIMRLRRANQGGSYHAVAGNLGSALALAGIPVTLIGNSDMPDEPHREAVCIAMDSEGRVPYGAVAPEKVSTRSSDSAYGVSSDTTKLLRLAKEGLNRGGLIVIDFGDTLRADLYAPMASDSAAEALKTRAVGKLGSFLQRLQSMLKSETDVLIVLSPNSRTFSDLEQEKLAPIVIAGPGFDRGVLTSPSTRTQSVVTLSDVAPTILKFLGAHMPAGLVGRPIISQASEDALQTAVDRNLRASIQAQRQVLMRAVSVTQLVVVALVTLALFYVRARRARRAVWVAALLPAALPLVMIYLPVMYRGGLVGSAIVLTLLSVIVAIAFGCLIRGCKKAFVALGLLTAATIAIDLVRGSPLISTSIAGYSVIEGARYYGIGNELMGTMIGASIAAIAVAFSVGLVRQEWRGVLSALALGVMFVCIGSPSLGANVGGALSAAPAALTFLLARRGWKVSLRSMAVVALGTIVLVAALLAFDMLHGSGTESHAGRAVAAAGPKGAGLAAVAVRKVALNLMLVVHSPWSRLLIACAACCSLLQWLRRRNADGMPASSDESAATIALIVGTAAAFAFNDSGVVAAATCIVWLWMMIVSGAVADVTQAAQPE